MIVRVRGVLESIDGNRAVIAPETPAPLDAASAREVLIPTYLAARLAPALARAVPASPVTVTLHTLEYLEGQGQGTSFVPRMLGFGSVLERDLFDLLTTVKGLGNKRALRALAEEPALIARAIMHEDVKWLTRLPEIGKRLAETIVVDLREKIRELAASLAAEAAPRAGDNGAVELKPGAAPIGGPGSGLSRGILGGIAGPLSPAAGDAVQALVSLGETPADAQRIVARALERFEGLTTTEEILGAALSGRHTGPRPDPSTG